MTVGNLKTIVLSDVGDSIDATILLGWLNRGWEYLQQFIILPELETTAALSFTNGEADLPSDFMHFVELTDQDGNAYRSEIDFENRTQYASGATPYVFYLWGSKIGTIPAATTGTLAYVKQAPQFTADSDTPSCPAVFQPLIAEWAKGLYRQEAGNYAKGLAHFTEVDNAIERLTSKLRKRVRRKSHAWQDIRSLYPNYP